MIKSYCERLFSGWAFDEGLTPLHIFGDFDETGEPLRLWWFFNGDERISPRSGLCDDETIAFFSSSHHLTEFDRKMIDKELNDAGLSQAK